MNEPFLFEDLGPQQPPATYTTDIEQASFDIMELVDIYFKPTVTVETYDTIQKSVTKILTEAFSEKSIGLTSGGNRLLLVRSGSDGEYNPMCPMDSAILTGKIYMADLKALGSRAKAIAAHNQGRAGVRANGPDMKYVGRVLNYQLYKINR